LIINFIKDFKLYRRYSTAFGIKDLKNKEAEFIIQYHRLEKGMLHENMKQAFARESILVLHQLMSDDDVIKSIARSQIKVGFQVMCRYYELQEESGFDISNFYTKSQYEFYKNMLAMDYSIEFSGICNWNRIDFYKNTNEPFPIFAKSRKSVREFTGEKIRLDIIEKVIELANTSPSVCNRQASNVYLVEEKSKIDRILDIQGGFRGFSKNVSQLLILTNDRKYYYSVGERNQLYIDGGIYLMNLLYALHCYQIGNCPANWGKTAKGEKKIYNVIELSESEKIICLIPIGVIPDKFRTTLSKRRDINENFKILN